MPDDRANPPPHKCYLSPVGGTLVKWREPRAYCRKNFSGRDWAGLIVFLTIALAFAAAGYHKHFSRQSIPYIAFSGISLLCCLAHYFGCSGSMVCLKDDYLLTGVDYNLRKHLSYDHMVSCTARSDSFKGEKFAVLTFVTNHPIRRLSGRNVLEVGAPNDAQLERALKIF